MKKLKATIALTAAVTLLSQNVSAEINQLTGVYSDGKWRVTGTFKNVSGGSAAVEVLKPGKTVNDDDPYAYTGEIPVDENGNFDSAFPLKGVSGEYILRVGSNGQIFEKSFTHIDNAEVLEYLDAVAAISSVAELEDLFESEYGRLKIICGVEINPADKEYVYDALYKAISSEDVSTFEELKKTVAEVCILNSFMNKDGEEKEELEKLFDYFDDEYIPVITLWKDPELVSDKTRDNVINVLKSEDISELDVFCEVMSENLITNALKSSNSKGKELKIVKLVSDLIDADKYDDFSRLNETKQINVLSGIKAGDYSSVSEYAERLDKAYNSYKSTVDKNNSSTSSSGGGRSQGVYVAPANKTEEQDKDAENPMGFTDLTGYEWAGPSIESLFNQKIIQGKGNGIFAPADNVKREEFISMIIKALKLENTNAVHDSFEDVNKNDWYYSVVASAVEAGIVKGMSETEFGAGTIITRQDAVVICKRAAEACGMVFEDTEAGEAAGPSYEYASTEVSAFADMDDVSEYAKSAVDIMNKAEIVKGKGDGEFKPLDHMTRAEAAVIADRLIKMINVAMYTSNEKDAEIINQLKAFGMYTGDEKGINQELKRGEAAKLLCELLGITPHASDDVNFDDVEESNPNYLYIETAVDGGYFEMPSGSSFNSDYSLDFNEAARIAVVAMGYEKNAELNGGYPDGYMKVASERGILSNIKKTAGGKITKTDFLKMFYNILDEKVLEVSMNAGEIVYSQTDEATFLSAYHGIFEDKGRVLSNSMTGIGAEETLGENKMKIGNDELINNNEEYDDYIGREVTYWYKEVDGDKELVYLAETGRTKVTTLTADDIEEFSNMEYTYYVDGQTKEKTIKISKETNIIYNTQRIFDYSDEDLNPKSGTVTFIDADGDNKYTNNDTVIVLDYKNVVVNGVDTNSEKVFDKYTTDENDYTLYLGDLTDYTIRDKHGDEFGIRELREWDILAAVVTPDKKFAEVTLVDECYAGSITSINHAEDIIEIDGEDYQLSKDFRGNVDDFKIGDEVTAYWDMFGNVVAIELGKASYAPTGDVKKQEVVLTEKIAILTRLAINEDNERMFIRTYYADKKFTYNELAEKVKINGKKYNSIDAPGSIDFALEGQLGKALMLKINENAEVVEIVTAAKPGEDENRGFYQLNYDGESINYGTEAQNFGFRFRKGNVVYTIPEKAEHYSDLSRFAYNTMSFTNDDYFIVDGYTTDKYSGVADIVVYKAAATAGGDYERNSGFVISSIDTRLDENDNPIIYMEGIEYYKLKDLGTLRGYELSPDAMIVDVKGNQRTDMTIDDLGPGDCLHFGTDAGKISTIHVMYDYSADSAVDSVGSQMGQGIKGYAYSVSDDNQYLSVCTEVLPSQLDHTSKDSAGKYLKSYWVRDPSMVTIVDNTGKKPVVKKGTIQDILTYQQAGNNCSKVVVYTQWKATVYGIVVYIED